MKNSKNKKGRTVVKKGKSHRRVFNMLRVFSIWLIGCVTGGMVAFMVILWLCVDRDTSLLQYKIYDTFSYRQKLETNLKSAVYQLVGLDQDKADPMAIDVELNKIVYYLENK